MKHIQSTLFGKSTSARKINMNVRLGGLNLKTEKKLGLYGENTVPLTF